MIRKHQPELVAAFALKFASGALRLDVAPAATIARGWPKIGPMNFMPPHDQTRDQKTRESFLASHAAFVASLPPSWREPIFVIDYSSNSNVNVG